MAEPDRNNDGSKPGSTPVPPALVGARKSKSRGSAIAIDTDGRSIWLAEASLRGSTVVITRVLQQRLSPLDEASLSEPAKVGAVLAKAMSEMQAAGAGCYLPVPSHKQLLRNLSVPVADDIRETASMVRFQVSKDLPFSMDDAVIDFLIRPGEPVLQNGNGEKPSADAGADSTPSVNVLAVALRRETVAHCEKVAQAAGIKLRGLGMRAEANGRCMAACLPSGQQGGPVALVTLNSEGVQIDIFAGGDILFTRTAGIPDATTVPASAQSEAGTGDVASAAAREAWVSRVVIETVRCLHGHSGTSAGSGVQRLFVAGATGFEAEVREALKSRIAIPCEPFDPGQALGLAESARKASGGAVTAIGLAFAALDPSGMRLDFLNPKRPAVQRDMRRLRVLGGIALAAAAILLLAAVRVHLVKKRMVVLKQLEVELAEAEKKRPLYRAMKQQAATVAEWLKGRNDWLDHYAYLSAVLPSSEDVYLTSFSVSGSSNLRLSVQARGGEILAKLDKQLRAAGYEVKPLAVNPGADRYGYDFRTTVELVIPPTMKPDLSKVRVVPRPRDDASLEPGAAKGARP